LNEPNGHGVGAVAPTVSTNDPAGAWTHGSAPVAEYEPAAHGTGGSVVVVVVDVVVVGGSVVVVVVDVVVVGGSVVVVVDVVVVGGSVVVVVDVVVVGGSVVVVVVDVVVVGGSVVVVVVVVVVVDVVVVVVGGVTLTFFWTVAESPSASVTVSLTALRPRVEKDLVTETWLDVVPSGNSHR
jgi:hypothetical protein